MKFVLRPCESEDLDRIQMPEEFIERANQRMEGWKDYFRNILADPAAYDGWTIELENEACRRGSCSLSESNDGEILAIMLMVFSPPGRSVGILVIFPSVHFAKQPLIVTRASQVVIRKLTRQNQLSSLFTCVLDQDNPSRRWLELFRFEPVMKLEVPLGLLDGIELFRRAGQ